MSVRNILIGVSGGASPNPVIWNGDAQSIGFNGTLQYQFNNDGTITSSGFGANYSAWLTRTPDTVNAAKYEIRYTSFDGILNSITNATINVWSALSSNIYFNAGGTRGTQDKNGIYAIEIRKIGTTTPVYSGNLVNTITGSG